MFTWRRWSVFQSTGPAHTCGWVLDRGTYTKPDGNAKKNNKNNNSNNNSDNNNIVRLVTDICGLACVRRRGDSAAGARGEKELFPGDEFSPEGVRAAAAGTRSTSFPYTCSRLCGFADRLYHYTCFLCRKTLRQNNNNNNNNSLNPTSWFCIICGGVYTILYMYTFTLRRVVHFL